MSHQIIPPINPKQTFAFVQDIKCTIWRRQYFEITAPSQEAAIKIAKQLQDEDVYNSRDPRVEVITSELMEDTEEYMFPTDNNGSSTSETYIESDLLHPIYQNGK